MRFNAAASCAIEDVLTSAPRPAEVLGALDHAVYLEVAGPAPEVIAVVTSDAIRLPCALVLGVSSGERPLAQLAPRPGEPVLVGNGGVQWTSRAGVIVIRTVRSWSPATVAAARPGWTAGLGALRVAGESGDLGIGSAQLGPVDFADPVEGGQFALSLLGRGPGLTPSGDDVLAGLVLGARAFGVDVAGVAMAIGQQAPTRTSALSARLLRHAVAGECVREVAAVVSALAEGPAEGSAAGLEYALAAL